MRQVRPTLVGLLLGALLLAGIVGFAVGLPAGTTAEESAPQPVPMADVLPPSLVNGTIKPLGEVIPKASAATLQDEERIAAQLEELFGVTAAHRVYAGAELEPLVSLTVLDREPGLFQPDGPPGAPAPADKRAGTSEMVRFGDVVCATRWGSEQQLAESGGVPAQVQCQRGYAGRTFEILASGLTTDRAAATLNEAVGYAQSREPE